MATTSVQTGEAQTRRAALAPAVRAAAEAVTSRRTPGPVGVNRLVSAGSHFLEPAPGSGFMLSVRFCGGAPGWSLDPGDGAAPIEFTGSHIDHSYSLPGPPRNAARVTARLFAPGGQPRGSLDFEIPRRDNGPRTVFAMQIAREDDWS